MTGLLARSAFDIAEAARVVEATGRPLFHFELGEPDVPSPPNVVRALVDALHDGWTHYTAPAGDERVRGLVAEALAPALGLPVDARQVVLVPGSNMVLHLALQALAGPGDQVLVPDPGFPVYAELVRMARCEPVGYPLRAENGFVPDVDELAALVTPRTRMVVVNSPHNPTGAVWPPDVARAFVELAHRHDFHVVRDEAYRALDWSGHAPATLGVLAGLPPDRTIVMETLSKSHAMCGWRAGIAVAPPALAADLAVLMTSTNCCMPAFVQRALPAALCAPESAQWALGYVAEYRSRRDEAVRALRGMPGVALNEPEGAFYAFPDIRGTGLDDVVLADRLLHEAGVVVVPGSVYGPLGAGHVRLAYTRPRDHLRQGLRRMHSFLEALT